jgi:peptidoglycan-N-acetylglucosamine deacetylase
MDVMNQGRVAAMTIDIEEHFQVAAFDSLITPNEWDAMESRVVQSTMAALDVFERTSTQATFFILGWVAKRHPELVKRIVSMGHEVASHGFYHQKASGQTPEAFLADVRDAKALLEDLTGQAVHGYRAPSFSINQQNAWAFEALKEAGHRYSSSTYPVKHDHYGSFGWPTSPFAPIDGLWELPQATVDMFGRRLPVGGGGYFRLFPYALSKALVNRFEQAHDHPYIFYFHPWEIDPEQPRIDGAGMKSKFRHYVNLGRMQGKVQALCGDFNFTSIERAYADILKGDALC